MPSWFYIDLPQDVINYMEKGDTDHSKLILDAVHSLSVHYINGKTRKLQCLLPIFDKITVGFGYADFKIESNSHFDYFISSNHSGGLTTSSFIENGEIERARLLERICDSICEIDLWESRYSTQPLKRWGTHNVTHFSPSIIHAAITHSLEGLAVMGQSLSYTSDNGKKLAEVAREILHAIAPRANLDPFSWDDSDSTRRYEFYIAHNLPLHWIEDFPRTETVICLDFGEKTAAVVVFGQLND